MIEVPDTRYVTVGDSEVAYQVLGDGPVDLVYHHGVCHVDLQWDVRPEAAFLRRLASFSRLILFDRRGTGVSERVALGDVPTWEEWADDLGGVLDAIGCERAAIFAEAEAGATAVLFAATHPDRVRSLILGNTTARHAEAPDYPIGLSGRDVDALIESLESGWGTTPWLRDAFPGFAHDDAALRSLARLCRATATPRLATSVFRHIYSELDVRDYLALVQAPTLVLYNHFDAHRPAHPEYRQAHAEYLHAQIPDAEIREVPGSDFLFFGGDIDAVAAEVAEFVTGSRLAIDSDRILTTVLFTDIVGSTERAVEAGDAAWKARLDAHDDLVRSIIGEHRGIEVNTTGDGFLARFDGPARAIRCARTLVDAVRRLDIEIRAGLHTGECELRGTDLMGQAVHVAARVSACASAGEVLVSRTVTDLVAGSGLTFTDRGERTLKGLPGTWQLFAADLA